MSRTRQVVGVDAKGRPIARWADAPELDQPLPVNPPGPVERRFVTPAPTNGRAPTSVDEIRRTATTAAVARLAVERPKEPAMPEVDISPTPLERLATAARAAHDALEERQAAEETWEAANAELRAAWDALPAMIVERTLHQARELTGRPATPVLTKRQEHVLELLRKGLDRRAIATDFNVSYQSVDRILEAIAKKGLLPADIIPLLPARFAKYAPRQRP